MKAIVVILFLFTTLNGCRQTSTSEDPFILAKAYCTCINERIEGAKDSSVDINECNPIFYMSRFMDIHLSQETEQHSISTRDSATAFFRQVHAIIDTMCLEKVDQAKLKRTIRF